MKTIRMASAVVVGLLCLAVAGADKAPAGPAEARMAAINEYNAAIAMAKGDRAIARAGCRDLAKPQKNACYDLAAARFRQAKREAQDAYRKAVVEATSPRPAT